MDLITNISHLNHIDNCSSYLHNINEIDSMVNLLKEGQYALKIKMCLNHGAEPSVPRRYYITWLKQIPWNPKLPEEFMIIKGFLNKIKISADNLMEIIQNFLLIKKEEKPFIKNLIKDYVSTNEDLYWSKFPVPGCLILGSVLKNFVLDNGSNLINKVKFVDGYEEIFIKDDLAYFVIEYTLFGKDEMFLPEKLNSFEDFVFEIKIEQIKINCFDWRSFKTSSTFVNENESMADEHYNTEKQIKNESIIERENVEFPRFIKITGKGIFRHYLQAWIQHENIIV